MKVPRSMEGVRMVSAEGSYYSWLKDIPSRMRVKVPHAMDACAWLCTFAHAMEDAACYAIVEGPRMAPAMRGVITPCDSVEGHTFSHAMEGATCYGILCFSVHCF